MMDWDGNAAKLWSLDTSIDHDVTVFGLIDGPNRA